MRTSFRESTHTRTPCKRCLADRGPLWSAFRLQARQRAMSEKVLKAEIVSSCVAMGNE
jgi:hypothetical protein